MAKNSPTFPIFALQKLIEPMKLLLLTIALLLIAVLLLGVRVLFVKNGKFPTGHVKDVPALRRLYIGCALDNEK